MKMKLFSCFMAAVAVLMLGSGCEMMKDAFKEAMRADYSSEDPNSEDYKAKYAIGIFSIVKYPRASELQKEVQALDGRSIWINTNQNFSSKNIEEAIAIPRPGNPNLYDLQLRLDRLGKMQWQILAGRYNEEPVALLVDGIYFSSFIPEAPASDDFEWVTLYVGIDPVTAKGIAKFAKKNYTFYNPNASSWF